MANGIIRKMDDLGRITLPKEYRDTAGIRTGNRLGISLAGNTIQITLPAYMENYVGMDRPIDELGRITLPMEIRRILNIDHREPLDMIFDGNKITVKKVGCHYCGKTREMTEYKGSLVCRECVEEMAGRFQKASA